MSSQDPACSGPPWWRDGRLFLLLGILGALYMGLQNGQWAPVSDADGYISIARNVLQGNGVSFNGYPAARIPPGWPCVLAAAMAVSPSFWFLNLLQMGLFLLAMGLYYRLLVRHAPPTAAFLICLGAGLLSHWFRLTFMLFSEGLFCVLIAGAMLVAAQIGEGCKVYWRLPLLVVLCVAAVSVRWAGVLFVPVLAGFLLTGQRRPSWDRQWFAAAISAAVLVGAFLVLRSAADAGAFVPARSSAPLGGPTAGPPAMAVPTGMSIARSYDLVGDSAASAMSPFNLVNAGSWVAELLFEPAQLARPFHWVRVLVNLAGWTLLALVALGIASCIRERSWALLGVGLYCAVLFARWPHPGPRYLVPIAPLLGLAAWRGAAVIAGRLARRKFPLGAWRAALVALVASAAACNLGIYAVDAYMVRQRDFYGSYYAGQAKPLIRISRYLREKGVGDYEVAVCGRTQNLEVDRANKFGVRGLSMLLGGNLVPAPGEICSLPPGDRLLDWIRTENERKKLGIRYCVYRPRVEPWRLWHFRTPRLQKWLTGKAPRDPTPYFVLYEVAAGLVEVSVPDGPAEVGRVPGL